MTAVKHSNYSLKQNILVFKQKDRYFMITVSFCSFFKDNFSLFECVHDCFVVTWNNLH